MDYTGHDTTPAAASRPEPRATFPGSRVSMKAYIADVVGNCLVLADGRGGAFGRPLRPRERLYRQVLRESGLVEERKAAEEARTYPLARFLGGELRPGMHFEFKA